MANIASVKGPNDFITGIIKYIPKDLIIFYLAMAALMPQPENVPNGSFNLWLVKLPIIAFLILTPLWTYYSENGNPLRGRAFTGKVHFFHCIAALMAFALMTMASKNPYLPVWSIDFIGKSVIYVNPFAGALSLVLFLIKSPVGDTPVFHRKKWEVHS